MSIRKVHFILLKCLLFELVSFTSCKVLNIETNLNKLSIGLLLLLLSPSMNASYLPVDYIYAGQYITICYIGP